MMISLLAFDFIAPMIGGVVIAGTVSFLGGVLLARQKAMNLQTALGTRFVPFLEAEIERLHGERKLNELEQELVAEFSSHRSVTTSLWELLRHIVPQPSTTFVALIGPVENSRCPKMARGLSERSFDALHIPVELLQQLNSQNPLVVHRETDTTGLFDCLDEIDCQKSPVMFLTALNDGQDVFGVLVTSDLWPENLPQIEQRTFMKRVAARIGKRCFQLHQAEQQSNELRLTQEMLELRAVVDSSHEDPLETLKRFAKRLQESTLADRIAIYFVSRRVGEELQPVIQCGDLISPDEELFWSQHERALASIAIESDAGSLYDGHRQPDWPAHSPIASAVTMPIRVKGRVLGALCVTRRGLGHSLENSKKLIEFGAETLSKTLGRVFEEAAIRRQARHDHLTDLVNRRSFDAYLATEIERVNRAESTNCSLIFADLDHFKSINDQFGHQAGDHVLREVARVLNEQVGRMRMGERSIVARYGGEEFSILLPGVGAAGAKRIAEGIRAAIEAQRIAFKDSNLSITISLGVAECPDQANSVEPLICAADKALYQAKGSGRNRVCHFGD